MGPQKKAKKGKSARQEGRQVAARVAAKDEMRRLWQQAQQLAREGKDGQALKVLGRAYRLAVKLQESERERWKWPGKRR